MMQEVCAPEGGSFQLDTPKHLTWFLAYLAPGKLAE